VVAYNSHVTIVTDQCWC